MSLFTFSIASVAAGNEMLEWKSSPAHDLFTNSKQPLSASASHEVSTKLSKTAAALDSKANILIGWPGWMVRMDGQDGCPGWMSAQPHARVTSPAPKLKP